MMIQHRKFLSLRNKRTTLVGVGVGIGPMVATAHARGPPFQFLEKCCTYDFLAPMLHGQNCFKARQLKLNVIYIKPQNLLNFSIVVSRYPSSIKTSLYQISICSVISLGFRKIYLCQDNIIHWLTGFPFSYFFPRTVIKSLQHLKHNNKQLSIDSSVSCKTSK